MLPSASITDAISLPPPTSVTCAAVVHGVEERLQSGLGVVNVPAADRPAHLAG